MFKGKQFVLFLFDQLYNLRNYNFRNNNPKVEIGTYKLAENVQKL